MIRTIWWFLCFIFSLIGTLPALRLAQKYEKDGDGRLDALLDRVAKKWALARIKQAGGTIIVSGQENLPKGACVFVGNHQGNFDVPICMTCFGHVHSFIAKVEMKKVPILCQWMEYLGCVFLDRKDMKSAAKSLLDSVKLVKSGKSLIVFPEGTRGRGGPLGEFKAGAFKIATKGGVPLVPFTIDGSYKLMEANGGKMKPATVYVTIHPVVETSGLDKNGENALPERIFNIIQGGLKQESLAR